MYEYTLIQCTFLHRPSVGLYHVYHIIVSDTSLKLDALGYISVAASLGISSITFTQCAPEATEFGEITQNKGHYAVQGHSRSPILAPVKTIRLPISD